MAVAEEALGGQSLSHTPFVNCEELVRIYKIADLEVFALQGLDLQVERGEMMAIIGNSGSGKTTLLNILGGIDKPTAGRVTVGGRDLLKMTRAQLLRYRRDVVGFVWQNPARNLIPYLTVLQNVELPMLLAGTPSREGRRWANELVEQVGLGHRRNHRLVELSMGEQQRASIAIALANRPELVLADEPTGSVDNANAQAILEVFQRVNREYGTTIIIVTHDVRVSSFVDRVVGIRDGKTSVEFLREPPRVDLGVAPGQEQAKGAHQEYVMLDRVGRLQLPAEFVEALGLRKRVRVVLEEDRVVVLPQEAGVEPADASGRAGEARGS
jgi:putative ABC transport system ATP-binding protein